MYILNLRDRIQKIIDQKRHQLEKEYYEYENKMYDTMEYYGCGGAYRRQEAARDKRKELLDELNDFERQLKNTTKHIDASVYVFGCRNCGTVTMTTKQPFDDWHECPTCRHMVFLNKVPRKTIRIAEDGGVWQEMLKAALEESE